MDRRKFLTHSSILFGGMFIPATALAQRNCPGFPGGTRPRDREESVDLLPQRTDGLDWDQLNKYVGAGLAGATGAASAWFLSASAGAAGVGAAIPDPATTAAGGATAFQMGVVGLMFGVNAAIFTKIASDPPRSKFRVPICSGGIVSRNLPFEASFPHSSSLITWANEIGGNAKRLFDTMELLQGAEQAGDNVWADIHYENKRKAYVQLMEEIDQFERRVRAMILELGNFDQKLLGRSLKASKTFKGRRMANVPFLEKLLRQIGYGNPCLDGFEEEILQSVRETNLTFASIPQLDAIVADYNKVINTALIPCTTR